MSTGSDAYAPGSVLLSGNWDLLESLPVEQPLITVIGRQDTQLYQKQKPTDDYAPASKQT